MATLDEKNIKFDESSATDHLEKIATRRDSTTHDQIEELSALEACAASRAAWLISITVSLGGLLFGRHLTITSSSCNH